MPTHDEILARLTSPKPRRKGMSEAELAVKQDFEAKTAALVAEVKKTEELRGLRG